MQTPSLAQTTSQLVSPTLHGNGKKRTKRAKAISERRAGTELHRGLKRCTFTNSHHDQGALEGALACKPDLSR